VNRTFGTRRLTGLPLVLILRDRQPAGRLHGRGKTVLKRLSVLAVVLVVSAMMAVPVSAQEEEAETADQGSTFTADFCPTLQQDATVWDLMLSMFPSLAETCGTETETESI